MQQLQRDLGQMVMDDVKQSFSDVVDILRPEVLGPHKHSVQYQVFQDPYTWSAANKENSPGDASLIQISQKGIIDLEHSYICFNAAGTGPMIMSSYLWEVTSYSIGNVNVSCNYQLPYARAMALNMGYEYLSQYNGLDFEVDAKPNLVANLGDVLKTKSNQFTVPFSVLIPAFKKIKHLFVGMGQHLIVNLRVAPAANLAHGQALKITQCSVALKYVQLDDNDMGQILKNKVQFPLEIFQCVPQTCASSMTFQLPIAQKDKVRGLSFIHQARASTADEVKEDNEVETPSIISGITQYRMPIKRISISYGQQIIVLDQSQLKALELLDWCDFKKSFLNLSMNETFNGGLHLDLTRFGFQEDPHGSEQSSTNLLVTIDIATENTFNRLIYKKNFDKFAGTSVFGYVICNRNFILENGIYRQQ